MGRVGDEHLRALVVAAALVVGTDNHQSCQFTVGSCTRVERELA